MPFVTSLHNLSFCHDFCQTCNIDLWVWLQSVVIHVQNPVKETIEEQAARNLQKQSIPWTYYFITVELMMESDEKNSTLIDCPVQDLNFSSQQIPKIASK